MKLGFLGPKGTFSEQAALFFSNNNELVPFQTIDNVLNSVNKGEIDLGVVPIENSTEGTVNATVDNLIFDSDLFIQGQLVLPIHHNLLVNKNNENNEINKIYSHGQALAQCRKFLAENYPNADLISTNSTAEAACYVASSEEMVASISPITSLDLYNLKALHKNIEDVNGNITNFILVSKNDNSAPKMGHKTTIAFSTENKPGELYKILDIFSLWNINMTRIFSRPRKDSIGEYVFYIDLEDSVDINDMKDALTMIKRKTKFYKILGSYKVESL